MVGKAVCCCAKDLLYGRTYGRKTNVCLFVHPSGHVVDTFWATKTHESNRKRQQLDPGSQNDKRIRIHGSDSNWSRMTFLAYPFRLRRPTKVNINKRNDLVSGWAFALIQAALNTLSSVLNPGGSRRCLPNRITLFSSHSGAFTSAPICTVWNCEMSG